MQLFIKAIDAPRNSEIWKVSNPIIAQKNIFKYLDDDVDSTLYLSNKKNKKYMIHDPFKNEFVHFGDINYQDFLKHKNLLRRKLYLNRACNIKSDWKKNKYSANNLAINVLWN